MDGERLILTEISAFGALFKNNKKTMALLITPLTKLLSFYDLQSHF